MLRTPPKLLISCLAILTCLVAQTGCATKSPNSPKKGGRYIVTPFQTGFYKYGPAQTFGPDFTLQQGARVTMLQDSWGFAKVMTEDGTEGYVASEDLRPAPPEPPPPPALPGGARLPKTGGKPKRSDVRSTPGVPLFDLGDLPFPDSSEPAKPAPGFRF